MRLLRSQIQAFFNAIHAHPVRINVVVVETASVVIVRGNLRREVHAHIQPETKSFALVVILSDTLGKHYCEVAERYEQETFFHNNE